MINHTWLRYDTSMLENYLNNIINEVKQNQNNQNTDDAQIREQYQQFAENNL